MITYKGVEYDDRHGGPFDRGSSDRYYGRLRDPHYYVGPTVMSKKIHLYDMTEDQIKAYNAGYDWQEDRKLWR